MSAHHPHHPATQATPNYLTAKLNIIFALAVSLNLAFVFAEIIYAFTANSVSLLSDAAHNFADVLGLLMSWGAAFLAKKRGTARYSYGYKKLTILAALTNALLLVFTSGLIVYEAIVKLRYPLPINEWIVMVVAGVGILINGGTALLFIKQRMSDLNIKSAFLHLAYDALIALGVLVAAAVVYFTGWQWLDPLVALIIVMIIAWGSWNLLRRSVELILGAVPYGVDAQAVAKYLSQLPGVEAIHDLHIWGMSTQENALTAHLIMPKQTLSDASYQMIRHVMREKFHIQHVTIQIERGEEKYPCPQATLCQP
jgi:cobalt-zinc-cadmium efflux system protein